MHNLRAEIETNMGIVRAHMWKELQEHAEIIEKSISKLLVEDKSK